VMNVQECVCAEFNLNLLRNGRGEAKQDAQHGKYIFKKFNVKRKLSKLKFQNSEKVTL
jgi:hypothetical protein